MFLGIFTCCATIWTIKSHAFGSFDHDFVDYDRFLKKVVHPIDGKSAVDYRLVKKLDTDLNSILTSFRLVNGEAFTNWTSQRQISFLVNSYNAYTLRLIADHYPVKSIRDIGGLFSTPWKKDFFSMLQGKIKNLDQIEHDWLRKKYSEPRIHFAIACASKGCPALSPDAYVAAKLDGQLDKAARDFLRDTSRNRFDESNATLYISSIFKWYGEDFEKSGQTIQAFVSKYMADIPEKQAIMAKSTNHVQFMDYDWSLNDYNVLALPNSSGSQDVNASPKSIGSPSPADSSQ